MRASPESAVWRPPGAEGLVDAGFDVFGCLPAPSWEALVPEAWRSASHLPEARTVLIVGSGGRALFEAFSKSPEAALARDPLDTYIRRVVEAEAPELGMPSRALFPFERWGGGYADFVAVARVAGLGAPSRLGLLLHPLFGPWFAIRAAILVPEQLEAPLAASGFDPCAGCPAPCTAACPVAAPMPGGFDLAACTVGRARESGCRLRCGARRACVVGPEHAYSEAAEAHHMRHVPVSEAPPGGAC